MANHNCIPRNGFVSIPQVIKGMSDAYGIGADLGAFFALLGATQAGDGLSFSIGGPTPPNLIAGGLLSQPLGISASHNRMEGDASLTRDDLYTSGDAHTLRLQFFKGLLDLAGDRDRFDLNLLGDHSAVRYNHSLFNNPYFFRGPIGAVIPPGTVGLVANVFSNKSAEYPEGYLSRSTLQSFYGVTGSDEDLQYTPGAERIPESWFKWNHLTPYTVASLAADVIAVYNAHPETLVFGGNTGTINSMTPVNVANLTGGVYNAKNLLQSDNLACFTFQVLALATPDIISNGGVINDALGLVNRKLQSAVSNALAGLSCPELVEYDDSQLSIFPGFSRVDDQNGTY